MAATTNPLDWTNRINRFRESFRASDEIPVVMWITQPWTGVVEILGSSGADAVFIDWEHALWGIDTIERLIIACEAVGVTPIVRAPGVNQTAVNQILDAGAQGVMFPGIETAEEAEAAVRSTRFGSRGTRGWSGSHNRNAFYIGGIVSDQILHGLEEKTIYSREYIDHAEDLFVQVMIESPLGVENVEEIASVPGVDAILFGWGDFSVSVDLDFDRTRKAAETVYEACRRHGVGRGFRAGDLDTTGGHLPGAGWSMSYLDGGPDTVVMGQAISARVDLLRSTAATAVSRRELG